MKRNKKNISFLLPGGACEDASSGNRIMFFFPLLFFLSITFPGLAQDTISPLPPRLLYITVEPPTGDVSLYWQAGPDTDVAGYIIYRDQNAGWVAVDTIRDPFATRYRDGTAHAGLFAEGYVIAAYDSALNLSPLTADHTTNLLSVSFDSCRSSVYLSWSGYKGWGDSLTAYAVYGKYVGGSYHLLDSLPPAAGRDTITAVIPNRLYCFIVKAYHRKGWVSLSNRRCVNTHMLIPPAYISCGNMDIPGDQEVHLQFFVDTAAEAHNYLLMRGPSPSYYPDTLAGWTNFVGDELTYTDDTGDSIRQPLYYRLTALNACGRSVLSSRPFTVSVPHITHRDFINHITWPPLLSYDSLTGYRIYRQTGNDPLTLLTDLPPTDTSYEDDVRDLQFQPGNNGTYCYRIEAVGTNHTSAAEMHSFSPLICITTEENIFFPNAFTPNGDGINDLFGPVFSYAPLSYHLIIRDRWGTILFESKDYLRKWDGKDLQGHPVAAGSYVYYLNARTPGGKTVRKTGQVLVIYPR